MLFTNMKSLWHSVWQPRSIGPGKQTMAQGPNISHSGVTFMLAYNFYFGNILLYLLKRSLIYIQYCSQTSPRESEIVKQKTDKKNKFIIPNNNPSKLTLVSGLRDSGWPFVSGQSCVLYQGSHVFCIRVAVWELPLPTDMASSSDPLVSRCSTLIN